jgi:hypothetical protein
MEEAFEVVHGCYANFNIFRRLEKPAQKAGGFYHYHPIHLPPSSLGRKTGRALKKRFCKGGTFFEKKVPPLNPPPKNFITDASHP